jgi:subtilase family serine protease
MKTVTERLFIPLVQERDCQYERLERIVPFLPVLLSLIVAVSLNVFLMSDNLFAADGPTVSSVLVGGNTRMLITESIDESRLVTLKGNTRPEATSENDRGPVADDFRMEHILLQLQRSPQQEKALERFLDEIHNPNSPKFHKWLTPEQFEKAFGLVQADIDMVTGWLESHGFKINVAYPGGMLIDFSGSARDIRKAFHVEIHYLYVKGVTHIANMGDPQIPAALAPAVLGVVSLHDFYPRAMHKMRGEYTIRLGASEAVTPADLATIYNLTPLFETGISGQGQTITVIEDTNVYTTADWNTFRSTFGLSGYATGSFTQVHPAPPSGNNNCSNPGVNGDDIEAILDAEYASAAAPSAAIVLASCANTYSTSGVLIALQNLINGSTPPAIISISYGECEAYNGAVANASYESAYEQAVAEGVSVFVAAGDEGAASCDAYSNIATHGIGVSGFASTPYNVAVGGTDFGDTYAGTQNTYWSSTNNAYYGSALSYIPEIPWNDSCASVLLASYEGYGLTYGSTGFCYSPLGEEYYLRTTAGSGGPSGCATGAPSEEGVVSGSCSGYAKPSWQSVFGNPNDGVRDIPDISLFSANGLWGHYYVVCYSDTAYGGTACTGEPSGWSGAGGTSFASPIMAGVQALVNQKVGSRQGNPNPVYYNLATLEYGQSGNSSCNSSLGNLASSSCIFYDVTQGDTDVDCFGNYNCYGDVLSTSTTSYQMAYGTTIGWDFATGIGSINAYNLVSNWAKFSILSVTVNGAGTGTVVSNPAGITCGTSCMAEFPPNQVVTLSATPSTGGSIFSGWSSDPGCTDGIVTLDADTSCTATFDLCNSASIAMTSSSALFGSITAAYAGAASTDTIEVVASNQQEDLVLSGKNITLQGGYDCAFTEPPISFTTITGSLIISGSGSISIGGILIQ